MEAKECALCCEVFNKSTRKRVECKCKYEACRVCTRKYLLGVIHAPHCMNCKVPWDRKLAVENLGSVWISKEYKHHRENVLFAQEQSLMPAAQAELEKRDRIHKLRMEVSDVNSEIWNMRQSIQKKEKVQELLVREILVMEIKIDNGHAEHRRPALHRKEMITELLQHDIQNDELDVMEKEEKRDALDRELQTLEASSAAEKQMFVRRCTHPGCRGFLSTALKCGICHMWSCSECREVKGPEKDSEHKCDPATLETVKFIEKDTKPCPKCACMIFKISGCDQMWCPECQTAFSWKTGRIEKGFMHNPHYLEYRMRMRTEGKDPDAKEDADANADADADADRIPERVINAEGCAVFTEEMIRYAMRHWPKEHSLPAAGLPDIQNSIQQLTQHMNGDNLELRIDYLRNRVSEEVFKQKIQQTDKKRSKRRMEIEILRMYEETMAALLFRRMNDPVNAEAIVEEMNTLRQFVNGQLRDVATLFGNAELRIWANFRMHY
jgi:hypothetical protein